MNHAPKTANQMGNNSTLTQRFRPIMDLGGRTSYERDYTAILYCHAFRRLRWKTQVYFFPFDDHVCTRLDHSLYVAAISSVICRNLNEKGITCDPFLAAAIGLGHDLGHAPFGHAGEVELNKLAENIGGFKHEKHGLRIVDKIEKPRPEDVIGLNLTLAVRDGIANHNGESKKTMITISEIPAFSDVGQIDTNPCTVEGCVVRLVDKIAYLGRDIEDAIELEKIDETQLYPRIKARIGTRNGEIVEFFVKDIIENSDHKVIGLSDDASKIMNDMLKFNYDYIYKTFELDDYLSRVTEMLQILFGKLLEFSLEHEDDIDAYYSKGTVIFKYLGKFIDDRCKLYFQEEKTVEKKSLYTRIVIDYIASLTDNFVFNGFSELFLPRPY